MATTVIEKIDGNTAKADANGFASYTRVFRVLSDSYTLRAKGAVEAVVTAAGITLGATYKVLDPADGTTVLEADTAAFCQEIASTVDGEDGRQWTVTVNYGARGGEAATFPPNPLEHPLKLSWGSALVEEVVDKDRDDVVIRNSAEDPFDPAPSRMKYLILLHIVRNEATFSPTLAQTWKGTVNDDVFTIAGEDFPANTVKISDITGELEFNAKCETASGWYWVVTYEFEIDPDTWTLHLLDQGMRTLDAGSKKVALDDANKEVTNPILLNGSGGKLAAGAAPTSLDFEIYPLSDFSLLGFDFTGAPGY